MGQVMMCPHFISASVKSSVWNPVTIPMRRILKNDINSLLISVSVTIAKKLQKIKNKKETLTAHSYWFSIRETF